MARNTAIRGLQIRDAFFGDGIKRNAGDGDIAELALKATSGLSIDTAELKLDLNNLADVAVAVASDSIAFIDSDDSATKKESIVDFISAIAGTGLTASAGVLSVDENIVEGDIQKEDFTAECNGVKVDFVLSNVPIVNSIQVYLNGLLLQAGSGKDYTFTGSTVTFVEAPETNDLLVIYYIINN